MASAMSPFPPPSRLLDRWRPGVWIGAQRRAFGPLAEINETEDQLIVDTHPPHSLIVLWRPPREHEPMLRRLPHIASLVTSHDEATVVAELLAQMPIDARLWMAPQPEIDWALMAEIVMISETELAAYEHRELRRFIDAERVATLALISASYTDDSESYRAFAETTRDPLF